MLRSTVKSKIVIPNRYDIYFRFCCSCWCVPTARDLNSRLCFRSSEATENTENPESCYEENRIASKPNNPSIPVLPADKEPVSEENADLAPVKWPKGVVPLKGIPLKSGTHLRFEEDGTVIESPGADRTCLRGVSPPEGNHIRFE
jgi:hypothetical protein